MIRRANVILMKEGHVVLHPSVLHGDNASATVTTMIITTTSKKQISRTLGSAAVPTDPPARASAGVKGAEAASADEASSSVPSTTDAEGNAILVVLLFVGCPASANDSCNLTDAASETGMQTADLRREGVRETGTEEGARDIFTGGQ